MSTEPKSPASILFAQSCSLRPVSADASDLHDHRLFEIVEKREVLLNRRRWLDNGKGLVATGGKEIAQNESLSVDFECSLVTVELEAPLAVHGTGN